MQTLRIAAEKCRFPRPRQVTDDTSVLTLKNLVLEPLLRWENGLARPGLFDRWSHDAGGRRWTFRIRPGATFHDGKPCEAEDVLGFIAAILDSRDTFGMRWSYARYLEHARITAPARDTVQVENPTPFADVLDVFTEFYPCRETPDGRPVLGTGRYRVTDYEEERSARLRRVAEGGGPAEIAVTAIPQAEARLAALRDGAVDVAMNLERTEHRLDFDPRFDWVRAVNTLSVMFYLNAFQGLFASPAARLAVNHAVDKQAIIRELFHGLGVPAATIVSPHHLGARAAGLRPIPYDPEAARRLFGAAGVDGPITLRTPEFMPEKAREITEAVAVALRAVGVESRVEVQPDRPEYAREVGRKIIGDMAIFDSSPHSTFRVLNDKISSAVKGVWWQGYDDPETEALIRAANHAVEDGAREAAYRRCLTRLQENPPWLYLFHPVDVFAARKGVAGLTLDAKGVLGVP
ncbi:ABC transporter substrate-binding protein [Muricoccus radiodurans]|uniref:ABC transporter substrate-binding protein n=1 Tax=Muricoccus radiodurans TaxID=2231721 RepID=UPI003CEDF9F3